MKEIPLTQGFVALVDDADFEAVNAFKWHIQKRAEGVRAVRCRGVSEAMELKGTRRLFLYQLLIPGIRYIDFRDGNSLNYSRSNLIPRKNQSFSPWINDLTGLRFARWTVLHRGINPKRNASIWFCRCDCGNEKLVLATCLVAGTTKSCGCSQREFLAARKGDNHPSWKGGRRIDRYGYVLVNNAKYPGSDAKANTTAEHLVVMARHLGRALRPGETVHHRNGIKHDNRIENLELWKSSHPSGQRVEDLVAWAKQLLGEYSPESLSGDCRDKQHV